jgi:hypothetical protein
VDQTARLRRARGRRRLGALSAGFVLALTVGAPALAATPAHVAADGGYGTGSGSAHPGGDIGQPDHDPRLLACLQALLRELRDHRSSGSSTSGSPPTTTPPTTTPPTTVPVTSPPNTAPATPTAPAAPAAPAGPAVVVAEVTPLAAHGTATVPAGRGSRTTSGAPSAASPPAQLPVRAPRSRVSQSSRALRTARSYGLLLTLAGAVLAFLVVQSRVDRRDPRIARAPIEAHRDFRDFE